MVEGGAILLADRSDSQYRLPRDLGLLAPCTVVRLDQPYAEAIHPRIIICDVSLDAVDKVRSLRVALGKCRKPGTPLLCVVDEQTHHAVTQAQALGATEIVSSEPRSNLLARAAELMGLYQSLDVISDQQHREQTARKGAVACGLSLSEMMMAAQHGSPISQETLNAGSEAVLKAIEQADIHAWLQVVWTYDDITYQHCLLVAGLAAAVGFKLGFHAGDRRRLARAALLHDIGKSRIPAEILNKPGRLSLEEMTVMHTHAAVGFELLVDQGGFEPELLSVVRHHHEYLDGSGYPDGLSGEEIPDLVRLTTLCDIYAALIERRAYKAPMSVRKAFQIMKEMGDKLDRALLHQFQRLLGPALLP